jgi:hypothetical protein
VIVRNRHQQGEDEMELIYVSANGCNVTADEVIKRLKAKGHNVGTFEVEETFDDGIVGHLEVDESILTELEKEGTWEVDLDGIELVAEWV